MVEESLLTPEVRALVGRTTAPVRVRVTRRSLERALDVYYGRHDRAANIAPGDPIPGVALAALDPEAEALNFPPVLPDAILISNEWEFERPLRMDEELTMQAKLADITERFGGRFGYSLYVRRDVEFRDETGEVIARSAHTMMHYDASNARAGEEE